MIDIAKTAASTNTPIDIQALFSRFTLDTAGEFLFGNSDFNTLDLRLPVAGHAKLGPKGAATEGAFGSFSMAMEDAEIHIFKRAFSTDMVWMAKEFFNDSSASNRKVIDEYLFPLVQKALEAKHRRLARKEDMQEGTFLDHLVASTDGKPSLAITYILPDPSIDIQVVRDQLVNMLVAARDTVSLNFLLARSSNHILPCRRRLS